MAKGNSKKDDEARDLVIRRATAFDVVNLAKMLIAARDEQADGIWYPSVPEGDRGRMMATQYVLALIDKAVIYVADLNGRLLGCIGCSVDRFPWSDDWMLTNEWFFVLPQFRDSEIALALLSAMESFADADQLPYSEEAKPRMAIMLGMVTGQQTGIKNRWMQQQGFINGGGNFVRAPQYEPQQEDDDVDNPEAGHTRMAGVG
jgi:GNAT superfamily N-acetyltransferase